MGSCVVRFERIGEPARAVRVERGASLMSAARAAGLPVARACGSRLHCGRCGLRILEGAAWLSPEVADERDAKRANRVEPGLRLACRARVEGPVAATADYW